MSATRPPQLTRRRLLAGIGGLGGAALLAACSKTDNGTPTTSSTPSASALYLAPRFDPTAFAVTGSPQRLVISIVDGKNDTPANLPDTVTFAATRDGQAVGAPIPTTVHRDGVPVPYFPVRFTADQPGQYTLTAQLPDSAPSTTFTVGPADKSTLVAVGQPVPVTDTPTTTAPRGVNPICTRQGKNGPDPCPLHSLNLRDALAAGAPVALLISTPQFCQIGVCGPVLQLVLEAQAANPGVQFIHAEVYRDPNSGSQVPAPVVDALGLNYEPSLYLAAADGTVVERLDNVFDRAEISAGLAKLR